MLEAANNKPHILFFGTEEFAESLLGQLLENRQFSVSGVVTKPDQMIGRKQEVYKSPVKLLAERNNLPIFQPESLKKWNPFSEGGVHGLERSEIEHPPTPLKGGFDLSVVCQYGKIIPQAILDIPKYGTINVHTSLLPDYRGASPIQAALINGETETGVTIMLMDEKMDHGPLLAQEKILIDPDDTYLALSKKMMPIAGQLLIHTLDRWIKKEIKPEPQDESRATFCKLLERDDGKIDWQNMTADQIYNLYRGTFPWPGIWTLWEGKRLKLTAIRKAEFPGKPGVVFEQEKNIYVGAKKGAIKLLKVQLEGKKEMDIKSFVNGYKIIGAPFSS